MEIINDITDKKWQEVLDSTSNPTFFHTKKWLDILVNSFDDCRMSSSLYSFNDGTETLFPLVKFPYLKSMMNSYFSSFTGVYGGLICAKKMDQKKIQMIINKFIKANTAGIYIYNSPFIKLKLPERFKKQTQFTHIVNLNNDFDYVWEKQFSHYRRNRIRRAEKSGVKVIDGKTEEDIKSFYTLYEKSSERWGDKTTWIRPFKFCKNSITLGAENTIFKLALLDDKVVGGAVEHFYGNHMFSAWRAFDYDYRKCYPNNLLVKDVLKEACERGIKYYDMGASSGLKGVIDFKESFGAVPTQFDACSWENPIYKFYKKVKAII